jgi:hypothetical protein
MRSFLAVTACLLTASFAAAQTETLRGKVEDVQGTPNSFFLDGTNLPLVSTALNLNAWVGQQAVMQVVDIGTAAAPLLRVDAAIATTKVMDMGNMRLGQTSTWQVAAPNGSFALIAVDFTANTGFFPLGSFGSYLLGASPVLLASGFTNPANVFEVQLTTPPDQTLLGLGVTSQAIVGEPGNTWYFSNPDNKTVQP